MFTLAVAMLVSNNKFAVGMSVIGLAVGGVIGTVYETVAIDVNGIVLIVSCIVMFLGGLVMLIQKEVRFAGSLLIYATVIEWLFCGYQLMNGQTTLSVLNPDGIYVFDFGIICRTVASIGAFIWAYGYNSQHKPTGIKKIISIISVVLSALATIAVPIVWFSY